LKGVKESEASAIETALAHTSRVFRDASAYPVLVGGENIAYAVYGLFHRQVALPAAMSKYSGRTPGSKAAKPPAFLIWCKDVACMLPPFLYSAGSILWLGLGKKPRTGIWTGDFIDPKTGADFRLGSLYQAMEKSGLGYVEFIRTNHSGFKAFWKNALLRRRPAIYYDAITLFLGWLIPSPEIPVAEGELSQAYIRFRRDLIRVGRSIPILRAVLRAVGVKEMVAWEYSDRQAGLIHAARSISLPIIGFMHGAGMQNYMAHEFISEYPGPGPLGPDIFGVWSEWWKGYFEQRSRLYGRVVVSGTLRKSRTLPKEIPAGKPIRRILWISEPLAEVDEVLPFLEALEKEFQVGIKKRPSTSDLFYNALVAARPEYRKLETLDGDIFEAMDGYDAVVGSHSTGVLDATWLNKPFVFVSTPKWGDYFDLASNQELSWLLARDAESLVASLKCWEQSGPARICSNIRTRFYGDPSQDGCAWVVGTIRDMRTRKSGKLDDVRSGSVVLTGVV
jgi:hypothetical protein